MRFSDFEFFAVVIYSLLAWQMIWLPVRFKMRTRIAVHPKLRPTLLDQLPPAVQQYLQKVTSDLASEGFTLAANMTAPRFGTELCWMQALFVNRKTSDLASVFRLSTRHWESVTFAFATQFKSGERVLTTDAEIAGHGRK